MKVNKISNNSNQSFSGLYRMNIAKQNVNAKIVCDEVKKAVIDVGLVNPKSKHTFDKIFMDYSTLYINTPPKLDEKMTAKLKKLNLKFDYMPFDIEKTAQ